MYKDADWYAEAELEYRRGLAASENELGPYHQWTGMATVNLARLYHEQGKYSEAAAYYKRAVTTYESPSLAEQLRQVMLPWIGRQIANCRARKDADDPPEIRMAPARQPGPRPRGRGLRREGAVLRAVPPGAAGRGPGPDFRD